MIELGPFVRAGFAVVALLGALAMVPWRQSRAMEALGDLDEIRRQTSLVEAERVEMERTIQVLESRGRVVRQARQRLGMHTATAADLVILPGELKP